MAKDPDEPKLLDVALLLDKKVDFTLGSAEPPDVRQSRLRREEEDATHKLKCQADEEAHKRRLSLIVHVFVMAIVGIAFIAGICIATLMESKTGLPDKAMTMVAGIAAALAGYLAGSKSK